MSNKLLYSLGRSAIRLYALLMLRLDIHWQNDLPPGPKLFVANHPSATDPFMIHLISPKPMSVLITGSAFKVPVFGSFLRHIKQIPVPHEKGSLALDEARQSLQMGGSVMIFPEGSLSPAEGGFLPPRTGAARLALSTGVPVIPVGIYLRRERRLYISTKIGGQRTIGYWYLRGPYGITVGQPVRFEGDVEDWEHVHRISDTIMARIRALAQESERRMFLLRRVASPA